MNLIEDKNHRFWVGEQQFYSFYGELSDAEPQLALSLNYEDYFPSCLNMAFKSIDDANPEKVNAGGKLYVLCPFHNELTPSFRISDTFAICYGCQKSLTPSQFYVKFWQGIGEIDALRRLDEPDLQAILAHDKTTEAFVDIADYFGYLQK